MIFIATVYRNWRDTSDEFIKAAKISHASRKMTSSSAHRDTGHADSAAYPVKIQRRSNFGAFKLSNRWVLLRWRDVWKTLLEIAYFDVRRIVRERRDVETYLGIQRELRPDRVEELKQYVNYKDASFPTGIIIAVEADCASYNPDMGLMTLMNNMDTELPSDRVFFRECCPCN